MAEAAGLAHGVENQTLSPQEGLQDARVAGRRPNHESELHFAWVRFSVLINLAE